MYLEEGSWIKAKETTNMYIVLLMKNNGYDEKEKYTIILSNKIIFKERV